MTAKYVTTLAAVAMAMLMAVPARAQTPDEMKAEVQAEFERLQTQAGRPIPPKTSPPPPPERPPVPPLYHERLRDEAQGYARPRTRGPSVLGTAPKGSTVSNSGWDGSVHQVVSYLKNTLNDPKSYDSIEWSTVMITSRGYAVRHKYRARNAFGGYVVKNEVFEMDNSGRVIEVY